MSRQAWSPPVALCAPEAGRDCIVPATVRPDWKMPPEPTKGGPWFASVHDTGDGWYTGWEREDGWDSEPIVGEDGWPFVEDTAHASDWEALGFEVV